MCSCAQNGGVGSDVSGLSDRMGKCQICLTYTQCAKENKTVLDAYKSSHLFVASQVTSLTKCDNYVNENRHVLV